jgi:hypothetical protein
MQATRSFLLPAVLGAVLLAPALHAQPKQERESLGGASDLNEVGKGKHMGRQALRPGAYITPKHRAAVQAWYAKNGVARTPGAPGEWKIGTPVASGMKLAELPAGLLSALPPAPPGNRYVLLGGDILLIAAASRIVVDAVPAR